MNTCTTPDPYVSPLPEEMFQRIGPSPWLSKFDLRAAFHQIPLDEVDQDKTSFWWGQGKWRYKRMFYGMRNATAQFQRTIDHHLRERGLSDFAMAYVDDILVFSSTPEEHAEHVGGVLDMLFEVGLRVHPEKTTLGADVVEFLGHMVSAAGMQPTEAKVAAMRALAPPTNVTECRSLYGLFNFYRCYIEGYAAIAKPISDLLRKDVVWGAGTWTQDCQAALDELKHVLSTPGLGLSRFEEGRPIILYTDWSNRGIGVVLGQIDEQGRETFCACASRTLNKHEANYTSYKGELLAVVYGMKIFRPYLIGRKFSLVTDHAPLKWLMTNYNHTGQYARWCLIMQEYDFEVHHRAGTRHQNADALSRLPSGQSVDTTGARLDRDSDPVPPAPTFREDAPLGGGVRDYQRFDIRGNGAAALLASMAQDAVSVLHAAYRLPMPAGSSAQAAEATCNAYELMLGHHGLLTDATDHEPAQEVPRRVRKALELHRRVMAKLAAAARGALMELPTPVPQALRLEQQDGATVAHQLNTTVVGPSVHAAGLHDGVVLCELFGGMCAGLEACLRNGIRVARYIYCDINPTARAVARHRCASLSESYERLFPPEAWAQALETLPQDVRAIQERHLRDAGAATGEQWLVVAGWECQDLSTAGSGQGLAGEHSSTFHDLVRVVGLLQRLQPAVPPGYVFENTYMQMINRHESVRTGDWPRIVATIGEPVLTDAARFGAGAHRLRNFWTNLASSAHLQVLLDTFVRPATANVQSMLLPEHQVRLARREETGPWYRCNVPGEPLRVLPTIMARHASYNYSPGRYGSLLRVDGGPEEEPCALERERIMGYADGATAAPGLSEHKRREVLGRAIDQRQLSWLLAGCLALTDLGLYPTTATPAALASELHDTVLWGGSNGGEFTPSTAFALQHVEHTEGWPAVEEALAAATELLDRANPIADIYDDVHCLELLRQGKFTQALSPEEARRCIKRAKSYCYQSGELMRVMANGALRQCPPQDRRAALIKEVHEGLGHLGHKRTHSLLELNYWWHGMRKDVAEQLRSCLACAQGNTAGTARPMRLQCLQLWGPFYRWNTDGAGPLMRTKDGNCYVFIWVEAFTKYVALFATKDKSAESTTRCLLSIISTFGAPAEIVSDGGTEFAGSFDELIRKCHIDHRRSSPGHPQANGAAERVVQTVKRSLRKYVQQEGQAETWDEYLPWLQLGYNASVHSSTGFSPFYMVHGMHPIVPPAALHRFEAPVRFDDEERAAEVMRLRAEAIEAAGAVASGNLAVARKKDMLRYELVRSGDYVAPGLDFAVGDLVWLRRLKTINTLEMPGLPTVWKVVELTPDDTVVLVSKAGERLTEHVSRLLPCQLACGEDGWPLVEPPPGPEGKLFVTPKQREADREASLLHGRVICKEWRVGGKLIKFYGRVHFLGARERPWYFGVSYIDGDRETMDLKQLRQYLLTEGQAAAVRAGLVPALGTYQPDEDKEGEEPAQVQARKDTQTSPGVPAAPHTVVPARPARVRKPRAVALLAATGVSSAALLPAAWCVSDPKGLSAALQLLMPGDYTPAHISRIAACLKAAGNEEAARAGLLAHVPTTHEEVKALLAMLDFSRCGVIVDPWAGTKVVAEEFAKNGHAVISNDLSGAHHCELQEDALQPAFYRGLAQKHGRVDAFVFSPWFSFLDMAVPLAVLHAARVVCVHVPGHYITSPHPARLAWLRELQLRRRLRIVAGLPRGPTGRRCLWLCIFASPLVAEGMVRVRDDQPFVLFS
jgi:site-specific DNA-cytosine methylase/transposase InsO family protein